MQSYKSRRTFQPGDFTGKTADNAREFISTFKNYCKLNNIDDQDKLLTFEMCLRGAAKCWFKPIRSWGRGGFKSPPPPIFCSHAFNFGAALLCVGDFSQKIV